MNYPKGRVVLALFLICSLWASVMAIAQTDSTPANAAEVTEAQATLRSNLLVQEQLHNAVRDIEQARQDANSAVRRNGEIFNERLNALEKSLGEQRRNDLESVRASNRFMLTSVSILGVVGILALLCVAYFQIRALNRVAEIGAVISAMVSQNPQRTLGTGDSNSPARLGSADQSNARFIHAIDQLEKKIHQLDSTNLQASFQPDVTKISAPEELDFPANGTNHSNGSHHSEAEARVHLLLTEGQALLERGDAENALVYFDQALDLEPKNTDALIKKGATLEALRKMPEAIETYDRAIAMDESMTVAYLYKGGVLNRLQRFSEAMECYEQALRTHPKSLA